MAGPEGRLSSLGAGICLAGGPVMQVVGPFLRKGDDRQRIPVTEKATHLFLWRVRLQRAPLPHAGRPVPTRDKQSSPQRWIAAVQRGGWKACGACANPSSHPSAHPVKESCSGDTLVGGVDGLDSGMVSSPAREWGFEKCLRLHDS